MESKWLVVSNSWDVSVLGSTCKVWPHIIINHPQRYQSIYKLTIFKQYLISYSFGVLDETNHLFCLTRIPEWNAVTHLKKNLHLEDLKTEEITSLNCCPKIALQNSLVVM